MAYLSGQTYCRPLPSYTLQNFDYLQATEWTQEGFDSETEQVQQVPDEFKDYVVCSVCMQVPRFPVILGKGSNCGHVLCRRCFHKCPRPLNRPFCKIPLDTKDEREFEKFTAQEARLVTAHTNVKCHYQCGLSGNSIRIRSHERFECLRRDVKCPNVGCRWVGNLENLQKSHLTFCSFAHIVCDRCLRPKSNRDIVPHDCVASLLGHVSGI